MLRLCKFGFLGLNFLNWSKVYFLESEENSSLKWHKKENKYVKSHESHWLFVYWNIVYFVNILKSCHLQLWISEDQ